MNAAIAALLIATAPAPTVEIQLQPGQAVQEISQACQSGSLIFSEGDCLAVRFYTNSSYTHVAMVICESDGLPYVYDSMNGVGVRKLRLNEYLETQAPDHVHLYHPKRPLDQTEVLELKSHLESQLGRPYSVKHHITGKRCKGLHCSEYVTDALMEIDWLKAENPPRVSPASLAEGVTIHDVYEPAQQYALPVLFEPIPEPEGTCAKLWRDTKECTWHCCSKMSRWFLCQ